MLTVLVVRLDSAGDVLLAGPAIRAVAGPAIPGHAATRRVVLLAGPRGEQAARLLPGVDQILTWHCPWVDPEPDPVHQDEVLRITDRLRALDAGQAIILTSFHQDPLPTALLLRMAGISHITAACEDYPGSLLDVRHHLPETGLHEVERMLSVAAAAGFPAPEDTRLRLTTPLPDTTDTTTTGNPRVASLPETGYVVVHPGASVPARAPVPEACADYVKALAGEGWPVVVTGSPAERELTRQVAGEHGIDLGGRTDLATLAAVLSGAAVVVTGNTGPAHLAAAVDTPVVSLFAPTVPLERWRPWGVPHVVLGAQDAPCAGTRARICPVEGHPCLATVSSCQITGAVRSLAASTARSEARDEKGKWGFAYEDRDRLRARQPACGAGRR
ncbi:MAG: glycosyltransferase family 9 protein [Streptosporangiaceae bacterium]|nr:glycosyltransferase family 9 protein [Streptosporangiaceae bacterium]